MNSTNTTNSYTNKENNLGQRIKNDENKTQTSTQNTNNINKLINTKPKINESALPSLDNNTKNNANLEHKNAASDDSKKQEDEKPKTGLAALFAKDASKSKATGNKDTVKKQPTDNYKYLNKYTIDELKKIIEQNHNKSPNQVYGKYKSLNKDGLINYIKDYNMKI